MSGCFDDKDPVDCELEKRADRELEPEVLPECFTEQFRKEMNCCMPGDMLCLRKIESVHVDRCIANEVYMLRQLGIETVASCCGHGVLRPTILVKEINFVDMENMGYESFVNKFGVRCFVAKIWPPEKKDKGA